MPRSRHTAPETSAVRLNTLDRGQWLQLQTDWQAALAAHGLGKLAAPATHILHDLLQSVLEAMHVEVFRRIVETDFGLSLGGNDDQLESLYRTELSEHGAQNIARFCRSAAWHVSVTIEKPRSAAMDVLAQVDVPVPWDRHQCQTEKLIDALGFQLEVEPMGAGSRVVLRKRAGRHGMVNSPDLLDARARLASVGRIFRELDYGVIHFSAIGEIIAVSPSMLTRLCLDKQKASVHRLAQAIPPGFFNDVIWSLALAEGNGAFENYRIRVAVADARQMSILFNVSGFRHGDGTIQSLWQAVSQDEGGAKLSQGSMLSEVRIHNITRNYVPQLVEQKAREAVRLGKTSLTNEDSKLAVLFCDVVGFTSYVESNSDSESIIDTLNSILRRVSGSVKCHRGSIDKFMGDCIMALFDDPTDAVLAALDMQSHSQDINSLRLRAGQQTLRLRIGIHWGEVVIGNVGTAERLDWTAIGDVVNTASRLEKDCEPGSILISLVMRDALETAQPGRFRFGEVFPLQVRGKRAEQAVCHVTGADG